MDHRELLLLRAARETGVLDALVSSADTPAEVAAQAGVTERAADLTVDALCDLALLEWVGDRVEPTNRMLGFVTKTDVRSVGSLPRELDVADALVDLPATMRAGGTPEVGERELRNRVGAAAAADDAAVRAAVTAAVRQRPDADSVLVVGDDAGRHAVEFAERGFEVALRHEEAVIDALRPRLANEDVTLDPGALAESVDGRRDVAFLPHVVRQRGAGENRRLLDAARGAVGDGGVVVLVDAFDASDPGLTAELLATTAGGECRDSGAVREWLTDVGFGDVRDGDVPGTPYRFVAGRSSP